MNKGDLDEVEWVYMTWMPGGENTVDWTAFIPIKIMDIDTGPNGEDMFELNFPQQEVSIDKDLLRNAGNQMECFLIPSWIDTLPRHYIEPLEYD